MEDNHNPQAPQGELEALKRQIADLEEQLRRNQDEIDRLKNRAERDAGAIPRLLIPGQPGYPGTAVFTPSQIAFDPYATAQFEEYRKWLQRRIDELDPPATDEAPGE